MKKVIFIAAAMALLLFAGWAQAEVCFIVNGSFEDPGWIIDDIWETEPNGWDVNGPNDKFHGYVDAEWPTADSFNLTLYSKWVAFEVNDMATLSQEVCLTDVNHIIFDLKLETEFGPTMGGTVWDPNKCTAFLLIDDEVVWESNSVGADVRDEYYNRTYTVEDKYKVAGPNTLSLGMRVNVAESLGDYYMTQWDFIGFYDLPCRGGGLLAGDFDRDCYVDMKDLKIFTDVWLEEVDRNHECNLFQYDKGIINFLDFAIFANSWDGNMPDLKMLTEVWLDEVDLNHEYNLFQYDKGIINFLDFAIFADNWLKSSYEQSE